MGLFSLIGSIIAGNKQAKASKKAAQLEYEAATKGIAESARQFDVTRTDFAPFQRFGEAGLENFSDLIGFNGADAQSAQITALRDSPLYQSLYRNGEEAVLANASATGELRGGDTKASLYRLGEDTLSSLIERQLANYGGAIGVGSGAAGAVGTFGANAVAAQNALRQQGAASQGTDALFRGGMAGQNWANAGTAIDDLLKKAIGGFGGGGLGSSLF